MKMINYYLSLTLFSLTTLADTITLDDGVDAKVLSHVKGELVHQDKSLKVYGKVRAKHLNGQQYLIQMVWQGVEGHQQLQPFVEPLKVSFVREQSYLPKGTAIEVKTSKAFAKRAKRFVLGQGASNPEEGESIEGMAEGAAFDDGAGSQHRSNHPSRRIDKRSESGHGASSQDGQHGFTGGTSARRQTSFTSSPHSGGGSLPQAYDGASSNGSGAWPSSLNPANLQGAASKTFNHQIGEHSVGVSSSPKGMLEPCEPIIDWPQQRVAMAKRHVLMHKGKVVEQGDCQATLETYPIQRDYGCHNCRDHIEGQKAYPTFMPYYFNDRHQRVNLAEAPKVDEAQGFQLQIESEGCAPEMDVEARQVRLTVRETYLDRLNHRQIARDCHVPQHPTTIPIREIEEGCQPRHDYGHHWSMLMKRLAYHHQGAWHEVKPCQTVGEPLPHHWDSSVCEPVVDGLRVIPQARRTITVNLEKRWASEDCEPHGADIPLASTHEGCEGQYLHDVEAGKSYLKKRHFFHREGVPQYVGQCVVSDEWLNHEIEMSHWQHDDAEKKSHQRHIIYIETPQGRMDLRNQTGDAVPYVEKGEVTMPLGETYFEGCIKKQKTEKRMLFERGDGSDYAKVLGEGAPIELGNHCRYREEARQRLDRGELYFLGSGRVTQSFTAAQTQAYQAGNSLPFLNFSEQHGFRAIYHLQKRTITTLPDGAVEEGPWRDTGVVIQG